MPTNKSECCYSLQVRGQRPMNKDHRYPGGYQNKGREHYQAYAPPTTDLPKPKTKTVVFAEACAQTGESSCLLWGTVKSSCLLFVASPKMSLDQVSLLFNQQIQVE